MKAGCSIPKTDFKSIFVGLLVSIFLIACSKSAPGNDSSNPEFPTAGRRASALAPQTVTIDSPDGLKLVGSFFESSSPNSPALLLLHQWQSDRHSFDNFAKEMQAQGFAVLSIDGRGFGKSTKKSDGSGVTAGRADADVKAMVGDVGAAFEFLSKQQNVDAARLGIVGASYGSSLAIIYGADNPKVAAVALLSPGLNYFGSMQTEPAVKRFMPRPIFLTAASDDPDSNEALIQLGISAGSPGSSLVMEPKGGHGTALLQVDNVRRHLESFCKELLYKKLDKNISPGQSN